MDNDSNITEIVSNMNNTPKRTGSPTAGGPSKLPRTDIPPAPIDNPNQVTMQQHRPRRPPPPFRYQLILEDPALKPLIQNKAIYITKMLFAQRNLRQKLDDLNDLQERETHPSHCLRQAQAFIKSTKIKDEEQQASLLNKTVIELSSNYKKNLEDRITQLEEKLEDEPRKSVLDIINLADTNLEPIQGSLLSMLRAKIDMITISFNHRQALHIQRKAMKHEKYVQRQTDDNAILQLTKRDLNRYIAQQVKQSKPKMNQQRSGKPNKSKPHQVNRQQAGKNQAKNNGRKNPKKNPTSRNKTSSNKHKQDFHQRGGKRNARTRNSTRN